jgi:hypothetical protein
MGDWTGTVPTFTAGAKYRGVDAATIASIASAVTGAWTAWSPTVNNLTVGSGSLTTRYRRAGKTVDLEFVFVYGAGSAVGTIPDFTLPAAPAAHYPSASGSILPASVIIVDSATTQRQGFLSWNGTIAGILYWNAGAPAAITSTAPWTWATGDQIHVFATYETA